MDAMGAHLSEFMEAARKKERVPPLDLIKTPVDLDPLVVMRQSLVKAQSRTR